MTAFAQKLQYSILGIHFVFVVLKKPHIYKTYNEILSLTLIPYGTRKSEYQDKLSLFVFVLSENFLFRDFFLSHSGKLKDIIDDFFFKYRRANPS